MRRCSIWLTSSLSVFWKALLLSYVVVSVGCITPPYEEEEPKDEAVSTQELTPQPTRCTVYDPAMGENAEWMCDPGQVCIMDISGTPGVPSEAGCLPVTACEGEDLSCACLMRAGYTPCTGNSRVCRGVIGKSISCDWR